MCLINKLDNNYIRIISMIIILITGIVHIVFGALLSVDNSVNTLDIFDASPLFDFSISNNCQNKSFIVFHKWGGRKKYEWTLESDMDGYEFNEKEIILDETDLTLINGRYLCYKHKSYKDLLYNGQIIKKGTECPLNYSQNCGKIDTLEKELCIKDTEKCPLYDLGIGFKKDLDNYIYDDIANIYYNNYNYNETNKTIIGKLILNEGQPCYNSTEKLWRQFDSEEAAKTHLQCEFEVFGKYNDDRYEQRGNISYKTLYKDNLNQKCQNLVLDNLKGDEVVYLYKRGLFGIDKECDEKNNFNRDAFGIISDNQNMERSLLLVEGIIIFINTFIIFIIDIMFIRCTKNEIKVPSFILCCFYSIYIGMIISCFICHIVFLFRIIKNDISDYNCSDSITNEVIRKETLFIKTNILYIKINLAVDFCILLGNFLAVIIGIILGKCDKGKSNKEVDSNNKSSDFINYKTDGEETPYYEYPQGTKK